MSTRTFLVIGGMTALALGFAFQTAAHPMDLRVYHVGARGFFDGARPMYGLTSGLGWPQHYRYPPLFMFLFAPMAMLPLPVSAAVWVILKFLVLIWLLRAFARRFGSGVSPAEWLIPFLLAGAYVVEDFRYGNAQFFIFALVACSLLTASDRPKLSAAALALAIAVKVWPLFFVPYFAARRDWRIVAWALMLSAALTVLPALWLGWSGNLDLLHQWVLQESSTQLGQSEIWFPNQSLRGVLMRYLTLVDYSVLPDSNYPTIHFVQLDAGLVRSVWMVLSAAAYLGLLVLAHRQRNSSGLIEHGLAFCLLAMLQPFTQKYALVVLLWPALVAGRLMGRPAFRALIYAAITFILIQPIAPGSTAQRLLQVLGLDFAATGILAGLMAWASLKFSADSPISNKSVISVREPDSLKTTQLG